MRIVHEIYAPMQVGGGGTEAHYQLTICTSPSGNHPELATTLFEEQEVIHIQGDLQYIVPMLRDALSCAELAAKYHQDMRLDSAVPAIAKAEEK